MRRRVAILVLVLLLSTLGLAAGLLGHGAAKSDAKRGSVTAEYTRTRPNGSMVECAVTPDYETCATTIAIPGVAIPPGGSPP